MRTLFITTSRGEAHKCICLGDCLLVVQFIQAHSLTLG